MDPSTVSVLWYRRSKPQGKVRRRVQDLRIPSSSYPDFRTSRPMLDLSHNESARLAVDSLLSQGLEEYHEVLNAEGEVDFLSDPEKIYLLENGKDGSAAVPGASDDDDDDDDKESLSAGSQSDTLCPVMSTESDPTMEGLDQSSLKVAKRTDRVLDEPNVEVYFQRDGRAAGMKDLVREFIRKATMALALVTDSFSDVELLCDLLEASRKRNVSVHLLLDHLNLNLFVSMWQDLKLNGKNFPKLSVHSVNGQTYCAKTGRKLTGQIAESFIINDWTEVLTGSYSFSWLSWQVHRSLAVLVKAGAVIPFHQEFHRLYSSAKPVPGFVSYITVPHTLPAFHAAHNHNTDGSESSSSHSKTMRGARKDAARTKAKTSVLSDPRSSESERGRGTARPLHRAGTQHDAQTAGKALEKIQIQSHPNPIGQIHVSFVQPQLTTTPAAERSARVRKSNPLHLPLTSPAHAQHRTVHYQFTFKTNSTIEHHNVGTEGLFFQQRNREGLTTPTGLNTQRRPWNYSPNIKPKVDFCSDKPRVLSPSTPQPKQANAGMCFPPSDARGQPSGPQTTVSSQETRRQDQPQRYHQPPLHSLPTTEAQDSKPASAAAGTRVKTQLQSDSKLLSPGTGAKRRPQPCPSQQAKPPPRLNWMPQCQDARLRPFSATYGTGQKADGQLGWRPLDRSMNTSLGRSKSMNDRHLQASSHT